MQAAGARAPSGAETPTGGDAIAQAHERLLRDKTLQFDRVAFDPPDPPTWLQPFLDFLRAMEPLLKVVFWVGVAALAALLVWAIVREIIKLRLPPARAKAIVLDQPEEWRPDAGAARDLLAAADALAAEGRYAEAAHLILLRSVEDIQRFRARSVRASQTTREIAMLDVLPASGRPAFERIGRVVERSLFGSAQVDADEFAQCRRAYEDFALPGAWRA